MKGLPLGTPQRGPCLSYQHVRGLCSAKEPGPASAGTQRGGERKGGEGSGWWTGSAEPLGLPLLPSMMRSCTCKGIIAVGTAQVGKVGRASQYSFVPGVRELRGSGELLRMLSKAVSAGADGKRQVCRGRHFRD